MLKSNILKLALFATGLSGIVAEYILSTLATYLLGDSVVQWTMIISVMMFSMGLGSRLTRYFDRHLLYIFILIEFTLSIFVSFSSILSYTFEAFTIYSGFIIYLLSICIGLMIGMEIPIAIRLNDTFESLKINVSSVIEKDYYGSLIGGLLFAFIGLPYLGLTYTPFVLGLINFSIACLLFFFLQKHLIGQQRKILYVFGMVVFLSIVIGVFIAKPVILFGEQQRYKDKIVYEEQSRYQKIVMTKWKEHYWLYLNGNQQLSTLDEIMYHEPLVHPAMRLARVPQQVLVMGGGDGCAVREILKYPSVKQVTLVDLDPAMTNLGKQHPILTSLNDSSFYNPKVKIWNEDGFQFLDTCQSVYDVIIVDLPDPRTVELSRLYSSEFYKQCYKQLNKNGILITQAGSPYFGTQAFCCVLKTMQSADFTTQALHNHVITLGEWGWVMGVKNISPSVLKKKLLNLDFKDVNTQWINQEAMPLISSFGKKIYPNTDTSVQVNTIHNPVLYRYYLKGNWDLY